MFGGIRNSTRCPIGVDIGSHSIRLLQLERRGIGWGVIGAAIRRVPADLPSEGPGRVDGLSALLRSMLAEGHFVGRRAVSCLRASGIQYKNLRLPRMPADELKAAVEWEATDRLRLSPDVMSLQFIDAGEVRQGEDTRQEIILLAAPHTQIDDHLSALLRCGLHPEAIDAPPGALARCLLNQRLDAESPAQAIIDVGYTSSKVLIGRSGQVMFFKQLDLGAAKVNAAIAEKLKITVAEVETLRERAGQSDPNNQKATNAPETQEVIARASQDLATELGKELTLCLRYYSVTFRGRRPEVVQLVGAAAGDPRLAPALTEGGGMPVEAARVPEGLDLSAIEGLCGEPAQVGPWAMAIGLSMRTVTAGAARGAA